MIKHLILLILSLASMSAESAALIDLNYALSTDKNTIDSSFSTNISKSLYNICLAFTVDSKKSFYFGWGLYNVTTKDDVNQQKSNYTTQDMGPYFRYEFGKSKMYYFGLVYGIQAKTSYDSGGTAEEWLGTNYLIQLGVDPEITDNMTANFSFNYFSGSASKKVVSSVQSEISYSKAFMSPSIGLSYKW